MRLHSSVPSQTPPWTTVSSRGHPSRFKVSPCYRTARHHLGDRPEPEGNTEDEVPGSGTQISSVQWVTHHQFIGRDTSGPPPPHVYIITERQLHSDHGTGGRAVWNLRTDY